MPIQSAYLTLLLGLVPTPAPPDVMFALDRVEVTSQSQGRSGFQLSFRVSRSGVAAATESTLVASPLLVPFSRVIVMVTVNYVPTVLMDGVILHRELKPDGESGSLLTVTGEDVTAMMDRQEQVQDHPAQPEALIALKLIAGYAMFGMVPLVVPPPFLDVPLPTERIPMQRATDLGYLQEMAARFGYEFYVTPGPAPGVNVAYWGPPVRVGIPQPALTANMGPLTNVDSIEFRYDATQGVYVDAYVQDRMVNVEFPVQSLLSLRLPLAAMPHWLVYYPLVRREVSETSGLNALEALARAQARTDASMDRVLTATGSVTTTRYGHVLQARKLVGVRGVGMAHDGLYYVNRVTHSIGRDGYTQSFELSREGMLTTTPAVLP